MSSSRSLAELSVWQRGQRIGAVQWTGFDERVEARAELPVDAAAPIDVEIRREVARPGQLLIGSRMAAGVREPELRIANLGIRDLFGEVEIRFVEQGADVEHEPRVASLLLFVTGLPATVAVFETLIADLERMQPRLLREVGGAITVERERALRSLDPGEEARRLSDWLDRLERAMARIEARPFAVLTQRTAIRPWRAGDQIEGSISDVLTAPGTVLRGRRVRQIGAVAVREVRRSLDVPEHRQLRAGVASLAMRARALERYCDRVLDAYEVDRQRWGGRADSVDEQRNGVRRRDLRRHRQVAREARARAAGLAAEHEVLRTVSGAVGRLRSTPLWLSRPDYRAAFAVLSELQAHGGRVLAGDEFRVRLRGLDQLFEYWCFARTLLVVAQFAGRAVDSRMFELIDDVYRPDLLPGQVQRFRGPSGELISVGYEPSFPPTRMATSESDLVGPLRSALTTGSLRPDVVVRVDPVGRPSRLLVLDAKNRGSFAHDDLWSAADYRSLIHDPGSGHQPARWMVYLHRDGAHPLLENLAGFAAAKIGSADSWYLAALCVLPDPGERFAQLVLRFLAGA